eukprot:3209396-Pyramimonas_sp.AAC.1
MKGRIFGEGEKSEASSRSGRETWGRGPERPLVACVQRGAEVRSVSASEGTPDLYLCCSTDGLSLGLQPKLANPRHVELNLGLQRVFVHLDVSELDGLML